MILKLLIVESYSKTLTVKLKQLKLIWKPGGFKHLSEFQILEPNEKH